MNQKIILDEKVIYTLGIVAIPPAKQKDIVKKLEENIQRKIILAVSENLNEEERKAFDTILELKDAKIMNAFMSSAIPDLNGFIKDVAVSTIEEFKKLTLA